MREHESPAPRWLRWAQIAWVVPRLYWVVVAYFGIGYFVQATLGLVDINSPLGSLWSWTGWLSVLLGGVAAQIYRFLRVSTPVERQQTRWVLFGLGVMAVLMFERSGLHRHHRRPHDRHRRRFRLAAALHLPGHGEPGL